MLTGNKGEWSELYVLLKLLGDGRIHAADEYLKKIEKIYFPILKVIRNKTEYKIETDSKVQIYVNDTLVKELPRSDFVAQAKFLHSKIIIGGSRSFTIQETQDFMQQIFCNEIKAQSNDKTDIKVQIHDIQTGYQPVCGFSIKSELGSSPTLINATGATNFVYEVKGLTDEQIKEINSIETSTKIIDRMKKIYELANDVSFVGINNKIFTENLMLIDSRMPELLAYALIYHYRDKLGTCQEVVDKLSHEDPLEINIANFYSHKFKKLLCATALGMKPAKEWSGEDEANGGYIVVTKTGDVLAYHIYNRDFFEKYLLKNTKFERASTARHGYASLYTENGRIFIKLNLQIRFN